MLIRPEKIIFEHDIKSNKLYQMRELNKMMREFKEKINKNKFRSRRGESNLAWSLTSRISYNYITDTVKFLEGAKILFVDLHQSLY